LNDLFKPKYYKYGWIYNIAVLTPGLIFKRVTRNLQIQNLLKPSIILHIAVSIFSNNVFQNKDY